MGSINSASYIFRATKNLATGLSEKKLILAGLWTGCHGLFNVGTFAALNDLSGMSFGFEQLSAQRYKKFGKKDFLKVCGEARPQSGF